MFPSENNSLSPLHESINFKIRDLENAGWEAYRNGMLHHAADIYDKALNLALSITNYDKIPRLRFMVGTCLLEGGRLRAALVALAPNFQEISASQDHNSIYRSLTAYLDTAISLPIKIDAINNAIEKIENYTNDRNLKGWNSRLYFLRAKLSILQGSYSEAWNYSQKSWAMTKNSGGPHYNADTHINQLVSLCILTNQIEKAKYYLSVWSREVDSIPITRELFSLCNNAEIAFLEGKIESAIDFARDAMMVAKQYEQLDEVFHATKILLRLLIYSGDFSHSQEILVENSIYRHCENQLYQFEYRLLIGDYYLANARILFGLEPYPKSLFYQIDTQKTLWKNIMLFFSKKLGKPPLKFRENPNLNLLLQKCNMAYATASTIGIKIDSELGIFKLQKQLLARLNLVSELKNSISQ